MKKKSKPLISIIMNCHNGEKFILQSLRSILGQSYRNWELIFYDNLSNDQSTQIIKKIKDKRIFIYKSKKYLSLYKARNLAITKAKGKYICFCDTDDWWLKSKLKKQVDLIEKKKCSLVFSNLYIFDNKSKKKKIYFKKKINNGNMTQQLLDNYKLGILTVMMKKRIFKLRRFNTRYNIIGDFDFFINLSIKENFYCLNEPLACYRKHDDNYSKKINLYVSELNHWFKKNSKKYINMNYSLRKLKFWFLKIKIKRIIGWGL